MWVLRIDESFWVWGKEEYVIFSDIEISDFVEVSMYCRYGYCIYWVF